jgi:hypothetical protein
LNSRLRITHRHRHTAHLLRVGAAAGAATHTTAVMAQLPLEVSGIQACQRRRMKPGIASGVWAVASGTGCIELLAARGVAGGERIHGESDGTYDQEQHANRHDGPLELPGQAARDAYGP